MKSILRVFILTIAFVPIGALAQFSPAPEGGPPTKTTFVRLANNANALLVEPVTPNPAKSRIAVLVTHPEHVNNFNYFTGRELPKYGYRVMMLNYYGPEQTYYEFLAAHRSGDQGAAGHPRRGEGGTGGPQHGRSRTHFLPGRGGERAEGVPGTGAGL